MLSILRGQGSLGVVLVVMVICFSWLSPHFLCYSNIMNVLRQASSLFMLAAGQTLVLISSGIDLSQSSVVGLISVALFTGVIKFGLVGGIVFGLLVGVVCGLITGLLVGKAKVQPFIVTLGMLFAVEGFTLLITAGGQPVFGIPSAVAESFFFFGGGYLVAIPVPVILMFLVLILVRVILKLTPFGRRIYSVGGNEEVARLSGINVGNVKVLVYVVNGLLIGVGSLILTSRVMTGQPLLGGGMMLESIGAVVIGGTSLFGGRGGVGRTIIGVLIISFMMNGLDLLGISTFIKQILLGGIIIVSVYIANIKYRTSF